MPISAGCDSQLAELLSSPIDEGSLAAWLVSESRLPGPRANLELLYRFATASRDIPTLFPVFERWIFTEATPGDPVEFVATCACVAFGEQWSASSPDARERIAVALRHAANDERWRVREGAAMGLQIIGERDAPAMLLILNGWIADSATLFEQRCVVATLAHPPILTDSAVATTALAMAEPIASSVRVLSPSERRSEPARVLIKGLSYALSVLVAAAPEPGFAMLERLVALHDPPVDRIVRANLAKNRIANRFPAECARIGTLLGATAGR